MDRKTSLQVHLVRNMAGCGRSGILTVILFLLSSSNMGIMLISSDAAEVSTTSDPSGLKTSVFLSPEIVMEPGSVANKFFDKADFPKGHIAVKDFSAEMVDESGASIPLHQLYVHHYLLIPCKQKKNYNTVISDLFTAGKQEKHHRLPECFTRAAKPGRCRYDNFLGGYGIGAELRRTPTRIPDPYGRVAGNPAEIMPGYEETWMLNVHVIDTRGVEDPVGCAECRCDLYNITDKITDDGRFYVGGYFCCEDEWRCRLIKNDDDQGAKWNHTRTSVYMKYTVKWVDWSPSVAPLRKYTLYVTDRCKVEYDVGPCKNNNAGEDDDDCTHTRRATVPVPKGGHVIYAAAHQHVGGMGMTLHKQDGRAICKSMPSYGRGTAPGDEAGYLVGMSACYPEPGSVAVSDGEMLTVESNYSSARLHTGVMGVFYILVADHPETTTTVQPTQHSLMME
uniref:Uncharacterized protein n=1 Tax=Kalanchoe fedtschenkoi TaxID=63787 RepID=A0A7N0RAL4_KALFE